MTRMIFGAAILLAQTAFSQPPRVFNAKIENRNGSDLKSAFQSVLDASADPVWVAYTVPAPPGGHNSCCWNDGYRGCALEGRGLSAVATTGPVLLEGSSVVLVLYRIANHKVDRLRSFSGDCELDAGGLPFIIFGNVRPADSVRLLESLLPEKGDATLATISMHGDPSAVETLLRIAAPGGNKTAKTRGQALFWVARIAGARETAAIAGAAENDPDLEVKKKAVFALSQIPNGEGTVKLIDVARNNKSPEVRKQAMFWLGQSKDPRAFEFFRGVLEK